jgi:hypothetical protein
MMQAGKLSHTSRQMLYSAYRELVYPQRRSGTKYSTNGRSRECCDFQN